MVASYSLSDYILKTVLNNLTKTYNWNNSDTYTPGSIVKYAGNYYSGLLKADEDNKNKQPDIETDFWVLTNEFQYEMDIIGEYCQNEINDLYSNPALYDKNKNYYDEMIAIVATDSKLKDNDELGYYLLIDNTGLQGFAFAFGLQMIAAKGIMNVPTPPPFYTYPPLTINPFMETSMTYGFNTKIIPKIPPSAPIVDPAPPLKTEIQRLINAFNLFLIDAFTLP